MNPYLPNQDFNVYGPRIRILYAQKRQLGRWDFDNLQAPYWRLYHMETPGAWIMKDGDKIHLEQNRLYLIPADMDFSSGASQDAVQFYIHFVIEPYPMEKRQRFSICTIDVHPHSKDLMTQLFTTENPEVQSLLLSCLVQESLVKSGISLRNRELSTRMVTVQQILRQHIRQGISNSDLAAQVNMSTNGFIHWFKSEESVPPQDWLTRERIQEACFWLHHTDAALEQIAELHGFCDRYHFSKVFKRIQGTSPAHFRRSRETLSPVSLSQTS